MDKRIKKQLEFSLEIDKEKNIFRQTHLSGHGRANVNDIIRNEKHSYYIKLDDVTWEIEP